MRRVVLLAALALGMVGAPRPARGQRVEARSRWVRPGGEPGTEPVWGHREGLRIGLAPLPGPRGLLRIYAPYLGQARYRVVNFISFEPVVRGRRGQSELERSAGGKPGLSFWSADTREEAPGRGEASPPARGVVEGRGGRETLRVVIASEPFRNGARPVVEALFRASRPYEVALRTFSAPGGAAMDSCVLSATMGNYGRLRRLWLKGEVADAGRVWPAFEPDRLGFAPWRSWPRERLLKRAGERIVAATSDEADPASAAYAESIPPHWRYSGRPATHYWATADVPGLVARVNGRSVYWGDHGPIPGGVAYENFELEAPFREGQELRFGVTPARPSALGFQAEWEKNLTGAP